MSNFLSPSEERINDPRYAENLFLDTTREAIEERGFELVPANDTDGSEILYVPLLGDVAPVIVRVDPDGRIYANSEMGLKVLKRKLGLLPWLYYLSSRYARFFFSFLFLSSKISMIVPSTITPVAPIVTYNPIPISPSVIFGL